jgi:hypothetical protein
VATAHTAVNRRSIHLKRPGKESFSYEIEGNRSNFHLHQFYKFIVSLLGTGIGTFPETNRGVVSGSLSLISRHFCINQNLLKVIEDRLVLLPNNVSNIGDSLSYCQIKFVKNLQPLS